MKSFTGFTHGMGIGGWLTNYKRFNVLPLDRRLVITIGDMEHFRTYITEDDVKNIHDMGMDHVRLGFDQIVLEETPYHYRAEIMDILEKFIHWCEKYDVNVVLNLHKAIGNYCDIPEPVGLMDSDELQNRFVSLWLELEKRFAGNNRIVFELLNEVHDIEPSLWNNLAERTINAIRRLNKDRKIIIGSTRANSPEKLKYLKIFDDDNIIYTFHVYDPFEFTHQQGVLQHLPLYYNRKMPYPTDDIERYRDYQRVVNGIEDSYEKFDKMDITFLRSVLQPALDFMRDNPDKILWCGEFGTIRHANIAWRENWMRDIITILKENDIPYCVWNYLSTPNDGNRFSLVDDDTREILSKNMLEIIRGNV